MTQSNKNIKIPPKELLRNIVSGFRTFQITYEGLGEMFEGEFADTCIKKCSLISMGGLATMSSVPRYGERGPLSADWGCLKV